MASPMTSPPPGRAPFPRPAGERLTELAGDRGSPVTEAAGGPNVAGIGFAGIGFADIGVDDSRLGSDILPVLRELRPHLTSASLRALYAEGHPQGLRFTAAYAGRACLAVAGWRIAATTFCGRKLTVDDLVVGAHARSQGVGRALLSELRGRARSAGCRMLDLDSALHRADAHRFYTRERMSVGAFHFIAEL